MPIRKTYIIASDPYMSEEYKMYEFRGTWRTLLEHLTFYDQPLLCVAPEDGIFDPQTLSDAALETLFRESNGDGQPYVQVWCVEDRKKVLG